jgi:DNA repair protein SbcD/Mre11
MRLLHVSDWHLGRTNGHTPRREDLADVLDQTVEFAREFEPDLVVHAGDLFDGPRPAVDDLQLACDALRQLAELSPVVVLAGNHDSPQLLKFLDGILVPGRIHFVEVVKTPADGGILDFETSGGQRIRLAPVPFISAHRMVRAFEDPSTWTASYADRLRLITTALAVGLADGSQSDRDILVFAAHLHVAGAHVTNSERPYTVSDGYAAHASTLPPVSYAAFGHIHRYQALPQASVTGRYAGSPIPLDFGEEHDEKYCVLIEADPGRPANIVEQAYTIRRPLRRFEGTLDELRGLCDGTGSALCQVIVHTEEPARELAAQVQELLPEAVLLDVAEVCAAQQRVALELKDLPAETEASISELFREYLSQTGVQTSTVEEVRESFLLLQDGDDAIELPELREHREPEKGGAEVAVS